MNLPAVVGRQIQARQRAEIELLARDPEHARRVAGEPAYASIARWLPPDGGGRVLELGCGPGRFVAVLSSLGYDVVGIDPFAFPEWDILRNRLGVDLQDGVAAERLPFVDASFDHVASLGAMLYFEDPEAGLREARRVIRPGGHFVLRTVNRDNLYTSRTGRRIDPASRSLFTREELVDLVQRAGFAVERSFSFGFWPPFWPNAYWYLQVVWLPLSAQRRLSELTPERRRINHVVFAVAAS